MRKAGAREVSLGACPETNEEDRKAGRRKNAMMRNNEEGRKAGGKKNALPGNNEKSSEEGGKKSGQPPLLRHFHERY